jgi:cyanophycin synthetase
MILDESTALNFGLNKVKEGGLVVIFPESVTRAINLIQGKQSQK